MYFYLFIYIFCFDFYSSLPFASSWTLECARTHARPHIHTHTHAQVDLRTVRVLPAVIDESSRSSPETRQRRFISPQVKKKQQPSSSKAAGPLQSRSTRGPRGRKNKKNLPFLHPPLLKSRWKILWSTSLRSQPLHLPRARPAEAVQSQSITPRIRKCTMPDLGGGDAERRKTASLGFRIFPQRPWKGSENSVPKWNISSATGVTSSMVSQWTSRQWGFSPLDWGTSFHPSRLEKN